MEDKDHSKVLIPAQFHSFSEGNYFDKCIDCDKHLLDEGTEYFIEKAYKKYPGYKAQDVIFEYAICMDCAEKMRGQMSIESRESIENYFIQNIDFNKRMDIMSRNPENPEAWIENCLVNHTPIDEISEYQIYAHCNGKHLNLTHMPYMVSGAIIDQIAHLLSNETLDELDDFMNKNFGPPPELMEPLPYRRIALV